MSARGPAFSRRLAVAFAAASLALATQARAAELHAASPLEVGERERLLVVAPHPDDETIGAGGLMQRVLERGGTAEVVLVTAGDGYPDGVRAVLGGAAPSAADFVAYGKRRLGEERAALAAIDPARTRLTILGFPDGALAPLRTTHRSSTAPLRSPTTGAADPPYDSLVVAPDAPYAGDVLRRELAAAIAAVRPTLIALPDPLDVHPDHSAAGLFALEAIADWRDHPGSGRDGGADQTAPRVLAYLVHWPDWPPGWDANGIDQDAERAPLTLPDDLPAGRGARVLLELDDGEVAGKRAALARHATQQQQMPVYLAAFVRRSEPFTILPLPGGAAGVGDGAGRAGAHSAASSSASTRSAAK